VFIERFVSDILKCLYLQQMQQEAIALGYVETTGVAVTLISRAIASAERNRKPEEEP